MAHARVLRSHGTTSGGVMYWEIRIEQLGFTDPLLQTMLSTRLRTVHDLNATSRHIINELSMLADTTLGVTAGYRHIKRSLPWLTLRAWRRSIHQLTGAGVLREVRRGNRFRSTTWQIRVPQQPPGVQLEASSEPGGLQLPAPRDSASSDAETLQLPASSDAETVQLPASSDAETVQLSASSRTERVPLPPARPYMNKQSLNRPTSEHAYLTDRPSPEPSDAEGVQLETRLPTGQGSQQERFIQSIEKRVDPIRMPDIDTIRGLAETWGQETGRTIHPAWGPALWELSTQPHVNDPIGFMTDHFRKLVLGGVNLSEPPIPADSADARQMGRYRSVGEGPAKRPTPRGEEPEERAPPVEIDPEARRVWSAALGDLAQQVTRPSFDTWLKGTLRRVRIDGQRPDRRGTRHVHGRDAGKEDARPHRLGRRPSE